MSKPVPKAKEDQKRNRPSNEAETSAPNPKMLKKNETPTQSVEPGAPNSKFAVLVLADFGGILGKLFKTQHPNATKFVPFGAQAGEAHFDSPSAATAAVGDLECQGLKWGSLKAPLEKNRTVCPVKIAMQTLGKTLAEEWAKYGVTLVQRFKKDRLTVFVDTEDHVQQLEKMDKLSFFRISEFPVFPSRESADPTNSNNVKRFFRAYVEFACELYPFFADVLKAKASGVKRIELDPASIKEGRAFIESAEAEAKIREAGGFLVDGVLLAALQKQKATGVTENKDSELIPETKKENGVAFKFLNFEIKRQMAQQLAPLGVVDVKFGKERQLCLGASSADRALKLHGLSSIEVFGHSLAIRALLTKEDLEQKLAEIEKEKTSEGKGSWQPKGGEKFRGDKKKGGQKGKFGKKRFGKQPGETKSGSKQDFHESSKKKPLNKGQGPKKMQRNQPKPN